MSNTGGDDGEGDTPLPPGVPADDFQLVDVEDYDPSADRDDDPPLQPPAVAKRDPDNEGTQDTTATKQPQQEGDQGAAPVRQETPGSHDAQSQGSNSVRAPSPSETEPAKPSSDWFSRVFTSIVGNRSRSSSSATADGTGNVLQRSNTSIVPGSRPVSFAEEPEPPGPGAPGPELVGPSRRRINSQGSGSQGNTGSPPGGGNTASRATRAETGLSLITDVAHFEAIGANDPTPRQPTRPSPIGGPRSAGGNIPDPELERTRRNRAFVELYDQLRSRGVVVNGPDFQARYDSVRDWRFQLDANALDQMANQGAAGVRDVVAASEENIPEDIRNRIIGEARRGANAMIVTVNNALADERNFVVNTTNDIITLIDNAPTTQDRRRGTSRASRAESLASNASQPELPPMDPRALAKRPKDELVDTILAMEQRLEETNQAVADLEDEAAQREQNYETETGRLQAEVRTNQRDFNRQIAAIQQERDHYKEQTEQQPKVDPPRQDPVDQPPSRDPSEGPPQSTRSRSRSESVPRSPQRQQAFEGLMTVLGNLARHEALARQLQVNAGLDTEALNFTAEPFSANAQLSRSRIGSQLREITVERNQLMERETQLLNRVRALEVARVSPPNPSGTGFFGSLLGSNSERTESSNGNARSRSGSRAGPAPPIQNLADELEAQSSGGSLGLGITQSPGSRRQSRAGSRQSVAGSRHSNASINNSAGSMTPPEGEPAAVNPAPLRAIPEWLATHPNGPCDNCLPVSRFPPELGELPNCGCTCDLAFRNAPPRAGRSSRSGSSRSRASTGSGRSVRFADDEPAAAGSGGRRPAPLDLSAVGSLEENNADRPNTPYPADAEGGQPSAPASGEHAEAGVAQASEGQGSAGVVTAPGGQAEAVPIQAPVEEAPAVEEPPVVAPPVVAPVGKHGGCPCCGRGAYGEPPAGGVPQVAFYVCRNMAGQPIPPPGEAPTDFFRGVMNALGLVAAGPRPATPGGDRRDENPPVVPEPPANGPAEAFVPGPGPAPRDGVMWYLTVFWTSISFCLYPLLVFRLLPRIMLWMLAVLGNCIQWVWYLSQTYLAGQDVARPILARFPMGDALWAVLLVLILWFITMLIAIYEETRIWKAANAHLSAAYFRGVGYRRPYPWYTVFEVDPALIWPALGWLFEWLHGWYFR